MSTKMVRNCAISVVLVIACPALILVNADGAIVFGLFILSLLNAIYVCSINCEDEYGATIKYCKFKLKSFKAIYGINPHEYDLHAFKVIRSHELNKRSCNTMQIYVIYFSRIDTIRYLLWKHSKENRKAKLEALNDVNDLITLVKRDIQKEQEHSRLMVDKSINEMESILKKGGRG